MTRYNRGSSTHKRGNARRLHIYREGEKTLGRVGAHRGKKGELVGCARKEEFLSRFIVQNKTLREIKDLR